MGLTELVELPGGTFLMGSDRHYPEEAPQHERRVDPFAIERHPVTNAQFAEFVETTGCVTVAERELDPAEFAGADPAELVPGSLVFTPTAGPVDLNDWRQWWRWVPGAQWRHPFGPGSSIDDRLDHPVVHVSFADAAAYAEWAGRRLPTEAEWEYAARGGLDGAEYAWGDERMPRGEVLANTWLGDFPYRNEGWGGTSPVGSYPPNGYGLVDVIGNVWEWTADAFAPRHLPPGSASVDRGERRDLLAGVPASQAMRVTKGGSHLCAPEYCRRYRPAARSAQAEDSATTNLGFRCAR
ncbi:formylglycine-generating enzyme required for sulfatase activity [Agromyces flavus]|uniref:Formylglycine-generating enzyme required for sulfatase activity n=1 Tax=Agromyces flavus TaxID=589382 RepID=A0A1H1ZM27_9MICO|nr:formylglycine-generating enzyme family protein [Agromyces flavus]MCP2367163.1 formylglycine-generating enzyme required for sulfatase activity [Agromyces flavus]GGI46277.1 sulfatase-modifying factor 1 [Agromyces flavus]SDT34835.1 Formylglycine-generating enzyme, required for sulfatase activity, contains SUMF1/FGE domain [Agromyces flavus]